MVDNYLTAIQSISSLEIASVAFGVLYIVLASRENIWCWPAAFIGTGLSAVLFWDSSLPMESGLNVYYLLMAVYGWWQWAGAPQIAKLNSSVSDQSLKEKSPLRITSFSVKQHLIAVGLIAVLTIGSGVILSEHTNAYLPFVDSFTTWAAVICTWMVTKKVLENWLYWVVINPVALFLCLQRELFLYAALYALYTVLAVYGYRQWKQRFRHQLAQSPLSKV